MIPKQPRQRVREISWSPARPTWVASACAGRIDAVIARRCSPDSDTRSCTVWRYLEPDECPIAVSGDSASARIDARFSDDTSLSVTLSPLSSSSTQVAVQVGAFGDSIRAKLVLGWISDEL